MTNNAEALCTTWESGRQFPYERRGSNNAIICQLITCNVGPYPALMLSESRADGVIVGEWMTVSESGMPALDQLLGSQDYTLYSLINEWKQLAFMISCFL
ncbi:hypothetical protein AB6A23_13325 [Paenibacillus tarimensis]